MCENEPKRIKNLEERAVKNSPVRSRSPKRNNSSEDSASGTEFAKTVIYKLKQMINSP